MFINCFNYDSVNPYSKIYDTYQIIHDNKKYISKFYNDKKDINNLIYNDIISGWDERFRGRGWEDYAFTSKIFLFLENNYTFKYDALHLYHPWEINTTREINEKLDKEYMSYTPKDYINQILYSDTIGDINKYNNKNNNEIYKDYINKYITNYIQAQTIYDKIKTLVLKNHSKKDKDNLDNIIYHNLCKLHNCNHCCCSNDDISSHESGGC